MDQIESTPIAAKPRRGWFRFSLRSLLLFSLCAGAGPLLYFKLPAWRLDSVIETTESKAKGRAIRVGNKTLYEDRGRHFTVYRGDREYCSFDFFATEGKEPDPSQAHYKQNSVSRTTSPDMSKVLLADECHALLFDMERGRTVFETILVGDSPDPLPENFYEPLVRFSDDSKHIAISCPRRDELCVLDGESGAVVKNVPSVSSIRAMAFSPDGKELLIERSSSIEVVDLSNGKKDVVAPTGNYYWKDNGRFYAADSHLPEGGVVVLSDSSELAFTLRGRSGSAQPVTVSVIGSVARGDFAGFSSDGHFAITKKPRERSSRNGECVTVYETFTGKQVMTCTVDLEFAERGTFGESTLALSQSGDLFVASNAVGDVRFWRVGSGEFVGEYSPEKLTALPKVELFPDIVMINCAVEFTAFHHTTHVAAAHFQREEAILTQGARSGLRTIKGEQERDYILRRNHPDGWYGMMFLAEFWLAAAVFVGLGWSLVRDWRELRRG